MKKATLVLAGSLTILAGVDALASAATVSWSEINTAAAAGYCLANHPYQTIHTGPFTPDGFEIVSFPGVVGAVRRNFMHERTLSIPPAPTDPDEGMLNTCENACKQWAQAAYPGSRGVPLKQQVAGGAVINSGLGDLAHMAAFDFDFYLRTQVVAGMYSRGNTWHESDVAQADFCCCQIVP